MAAARTDRVRTDRMSFALDRHDAHLRRGIHDARHARSVRCKDELGRKVTLLRRRRRCAAIRPVGRAVARSSGGPAAAAEPQTRERPATHRAMRRIICLGRMTYLSGKPLALDHAGTCHLTEGTSPNSGSDFLSRSRKRVTRQQLWNRAILQPGALPCEDATGPPDWPDRGIHPCVQGQWRAGSRLRSLFQWFCFFPRAAGAIHRQAMLPSPSISTAP